MYQRNFWDFFSAKVRKKIFIFTLKTKYLSSYVNQKCSQGDVLGYESGFVQMGSGEHSELQSRNCRSSRVHSCHKDEVEVKVDVPVTKV